jgi:hypothetical protein
LLLKRKQFVEKIKSYLPCKDHGYALFVHKYLSDNIEKKDPIYFGMQKRLKRSLNFYLRKGYLTASFLGEKEKILQERLEKLFNRILDFCTYYNDIYSLVLNPLIRERVLHIFFEDFSKNKTNLTDDNIVENKTKLFRYAMISQTITYVRQMISCGVLFLGEDKISDSMVKDYVEENISERVILLDKKEFLLELERISIGFYYYLLSNILQKREESKDLDLIKNMIKILNKSPGTKHYYNYLISLFKKMFVAQSKVEFESVVLSCFSQDINLIFRKLHKDVLVYLESEDKAEGLCRRYDFLKSGYGSFLR